MGLEGRCHYHHKARSVCKSTRGCSGRAGRCSRFTGRWMHLLDICILRPVPPSGFSPELLDA